MRWYLASVLSVLAAGFLHGLATPLAAPWGNMRMKHAWTAVPADFNPFLYGQGVKGLTDITSGSNPGCKTEGFSAIPGWDPVTGLGTLKFDDLQGILRTLYFTNTEN